MRMKLNPVEIHEFQMILDYELKKKQYERFVSNRIYEIIAANRAIVIECGVFSIHSHSLDDPFKFWVYKIKKNLWDSMRENGSILICPPTYCDAYYKNVDNIQDFVLWQITQDMLISDDWQEELKEKLKKTKDTL